ncbi:MAG: GNAT family N-acetyltransferase [Ilumatobacteraceae bacterium]
MTTAEHHATGVSDERVEILDNLVWSALTSTQSRFAQGTGLARRFDPDVAAFVAVRQATQSAWADLLRLVGPGAVVLLAGGAEIDPPADWERIGGGFGNQMILDRLTAAPAIDGTIRPLNASDVPEMSALVELTQPGPFRPRTIELGDYFGIFEAGALVAMAGERLQTPEFTEVSAVCTHPSARGRGLAAALSHRVATGILTRGQTPILHVAVTNVGARRVYERLGFVVRRELAFLAVKTPAQDPSVDPDCDEPGVDGS